MMMSFILVSQIFMDTLVCQPGDGSASTSAQVTDTRPAKDIPTAELTCKKDEVDELVDKEKAKGKPDKDIVGNMKQQLKLVALHQRELFT